MIVSCASPTSTGTGSPRSSPTRQGGSWPTSSCGTVAAPAPRTASAPPRTPGLANLPLHAFAANQIWCAIVALAADPTAWMQTLALTEHAARRWAPKRLRLRLLGIAGRLAVIGRRRLLHLAATAPWTDLALTGLRRLDALAIPG
jgi:Transposase DDE domain group 1